MQIPPNPLDFSVYFVYNVYIGQRVERERTMRKPPTTGATRYISSRAGSAWHIFGMRHADGFIYDCRDFDSEEAAITAATKARKFFGERAMIEDLTE